MSRLLVAVASCAALAGACSHEGTYQLSWTFVAPATGGALDGGAAADDGGAADAADAADAEMVTENPAVACARHGVFAIRITGVSRQGGGEDVVTTCAAGTT